MRNIVIGLVCLLFSSLPATVDTWIGADVVRSAYVQRSLAIRCDDDLAGKAVKRLSPDQIEMLDNPTIWRTEMQKHRMDLTPGSCLS